MFTHTHTHTRYNREREGGARERERENVLSTLLENKRKYFILVLDTDP